MPLTVDRRTAFAPTETHGDLPSKSKVTRNCASTRHPRGWAGRPSSLSTVVLVERRWSNPWLKLIAALMLVGFMGAYFWWIVAAFAAVGLVYYGRRWWRSECLPPPSSRLSAWRSWRGRISSTPGCWRETSVERMARFRWRAGADLYRRTDALASCGAGLARTGNLS